ALVVDGHSGMAFMEKPPASKVLLDNMVPLTAAIEASQSLQSHIVRRYSDFDLLNNSLQTAGLSLPLPPTKLIGNMDHEFIAGRQKGLQNYLNIITTNHILSNCELVKKLLDPNNYSADYTEIALQQVSMFFQSEPKWEVAEPLKYIGWRIRKKYFLMKIKNQPKEQLVMFNEKGTLKDLIYKAKPKDPFLRYYCNPKKIQGRELQQIKTYGQQILAVLKFLLDKGFPYGHLHASNSTLSCEACKDGRSTISWLLQMPLFSDVLLTTSEKPQFKIPT
ncbi:hypothetical protein E2I00_005069, partial [Balaenoptera physalus]